MNQSERYIKCYRCDWTGQVKDLGDDQGVEYCPNCLSIACLEITTKEDVELIKKKFSSTQPSITNNEY